MKKTSGDAASDELRQEYSFDYSKARPNRFSQPSNEEHRNFVVALDPDVAQVFTSAEHVNAILRALIQNMPKIVRPTKAG
jgi:hypothetical protein